ncbi:MAG: hypothetical protein R2883_05690 [Caldisericia bacterium]
MANITWLNETMEKYKELLIRKSVNSKSIIKIRRDKLEKKSSYLEDKILDFSDLFMILTKHEELFIDLWYLKELPKKEIAQKFSLSKATIYRMRSNIAKKLYENKGILNKSGTT